MKKIKATSATILLLCMAIGVICICLLVIDLDKPVEYDFLFLLPLTFIAGCIVAYRIFDLIPNNLGVSIIVILFFVRMVISPFLMCLGDYAVTISLGVKSNTLPAILLVCYENIIVFITLGILTSKCPHGAQNSIQIVTKQKMKFRYKMILVAVLVVLGVCIVYTPPLLKTYRTIFQIGDEFFTHYEDGMITNQYGTTFLSKLSLVTGQYLMRAVIVMIPASVIIACSNARKKFWKWFSLCFAAVPLFFIGGAIARSLIYCVVLLMLWNLLYNKEKFAKKTIILLFFAAVAVMAWWVLRSSVSQSGNSVSVWETYSKRFSAYFSGVNVVSGAFNMERTFDLRLRYFAYDFLSTFPYGNTIFGISHDTIQPFFNLMNQSSGQIPTTIGMGYYYFGALLSPIYSVIFAIVAFKASEKLMNPSTNPIRYLRLLLTVFQFSMGIIMYNIEITMTNFWTLLLPLYLIEKFSYIKDEYIQGGV